jgi:hypothetical protein
MISKATEQSLPIIIARARVCVYIYSWKHLNHLYLESKGFWLRFTTLGITGFVDFVNLPELQILENTTFQKLDLFLCSD